MKANFFNTVFPAFILAVLFLYGGIYINEANLENTLIQSRNEIISDTANLKSQIESTINADLYLMNGLVATIKANPEFDNETYSYYASEMIKIQPRIRNIALAQNYIVTHTYPLEGNEKVLGIDYRNIPAQYESAKKVEEAGSIVILGPLDLVQGGKGIIGRVPIFSPQGNENKVEKFWGFITTVIDLDEFYQTIELDSYLSRMNIAIETNSGSTGTKEVFIGDENLFATDAVIVDVNISNGLWRIAAEPVNGWPYTAANKGWILLISIFAAITTVILGYIILIYLKHTENANLDISVAYTKAEQANKSKSDFLANFSHELRTPLNAIIGFSEAMQIGVHGAVENKKHLEYLKHIESSGRHLTAIINDILDMAKIEAGEYKVHIEPLNPVEVVDDVVKIISHRATNKSVNIEFTKPDIDLIMMADELRFRQILINILVNAVKFSPSNGVVKVDLKQTKDQIIILIKDYGVGMDQNEIKDAMRPFGTASNYHEDNINTGLGLPVSIEFAQLMNGNILLQSTKGAGTTVIVTLPAA